MACDNNPRVIKLQQCIGRGGGSRGNLSHGGRKQKKVRDSQLSVSNRCKSSLVYCMWLGRRMRYFMLEKEHSLRSFFVVVVLNISRKHLKKECHTVHH